MQSWLGWKVSCARSCAGLSGIKHSWGVCGVILQILRVYGIWSSAMATAMGVKIDSCARWFTGRIRLWCRRRISLGFICSTGADLVLELVHHFRRLRNNSKIDNEEGICWNVRGIGCNLRDQQGDFLAIFLLQFTLWRDHKLGGIPMSTNTKCFITTQIP